MSDIRLPTREEMRELSPLELAKTHCLAEDAGDVATVVDTFTTLDPYYRVPSLGIDVAGIEQIRAFYTASLGALPDLVNLEPTWIETPGHVFLSVAFEATFSVSIHVGEVVLRRVGA